MSSRSISPSPPTTAACSTGRRRCGRELLALPGVDLRRLSAIWPDLSTVPPEVAEQVEIEARYAPYLRRLEAEIEAFRRDQRLVLPDGLDYSSLGGLNLELREKLTRARPATLAAPIDCSSPGSAPPTRRRASSGGRRSAGRGRRGSVSGRRLQVHPAGPVNPMAGWTRLVNPWRAALNFVVLYLCRFLPWVGVKRFLYRRLGMKVGKDVAVGLGAMFDIFFPQLISIGDNSVIGYNVTILCHEFRVREFCTGRVEIGPDVLIGANSTILPGVVVGAGAQVGAGSLVNRDIPPGVLAAGVPARVIRKIEDF